MLLVFLFSLCAYHSSDFILNGVSRKRKRRRRRRRRRKESQRTRERESGVSKPHLHFQRRYRPTSFHSILHVANISPNWQTSKGPCARDQAKCFMHRELTGRLMYDFFGKGCGCLFVSSCVWVSVWFCGCLCRSVGLWVWVCRFLCVCGCLCVGCLCQVGQVWIGRGRGEFSKWNRWDGFAKWSKCK